MRVRVEVEEIELEGEHGGIIPSICVTCTKCGECAEVWGTTARSVRRGCIMLREGCEEDNYYYCDEGEEDE
jgi:hypothetical protein